MARTRRDARLESRDARRKLKKRHTPYAKTIHGGLSICYRSTSGTWLVRRYLGDGKYDWKQLGSADDYAAADGISVLSFEQAQKKAMEFGEGEVSKEAGKRLSTYTVGEALEDYLEDYVSRSKASESTKRATAATARKHIARKLGRIEISELTKARIRSWHSRLAKVDADALEHDEIREAQRKGQSTANRVLSTLKAALNLAYDQGYVPNDVAWKGVKPFRGVDLPKVRFLTTSEVSRFLPACDESFRPLAEAALLTGGRWSELTGLKVKDYDTQNGTVFFPEGKGKRRHVPLTEEGRQFFDAHTAGRFGNERVFLKNGEPWGKSHQVRPMRRACRDGKIEPAISFHILRHTYGSLLVQKGVPLKFVAECLGHADTRITERHYGHLQPDIVAETIRRELPEFGVSTSNVVPIERASNG